MDIKSVIHESWHDLFDENEEYLNELMRDMEMFPENSVYPPRHQIFRVFQMNLNDISVFVVGQDPYHQKGQANGLCFAVNEGVKIPPSLMNIFKELKAEFPDRGYDFQHGDLSRWFEEEKFFLMNTALTVLDSRAGIFLKKWEPFTDKVIEYVQERNPGCLFLLLGNPAQKKMKFIENEDRCVLGVHPSPLSANRGFFGSNIFIEIENKLGRPVNWQN